MTETIRSWYQKNSQEIKLIQYLLYHLKKNGHTIETRKQQKKNVPDIKLELGEFIIEFK
jgi:hypothetical protein